MISDFKNNNIDDFMCISFRKKNEIFHKNYVNKILYYDNMNSLLSKDKENNNYFFTGGADSIIKLWENNHSVELKLLNNFEHHINKICDLESSKKNNLLLSSSYDKLLCIWDLNNIINQEEKTLVSCYNKINQNYISCLKYCEVNDILYCLDSENIFTINLDKNVENKIFSQNKIISFDISQDGKYIIASLDNEIVLIDAESHEIINKFKGNDSKIKKIIISSDGKKMITSNLDNIIEIWDIQEQKVIMNLNNIVSGITSLFPFKDFNQILIGNLNGELLIYDVNQQKSNSIDNIFVPIKETKMNEEQNQIILSTENGLLNIYDLIYKKINFSFKNDNIGKITLKKDVYEVNLDSNEKYNVSKYTGEIVKNKIINYELMNNKVYSIIQYEDSNKLDIINLLQLKYFEVKNDITYNDLIDKIKEINKDSLNPWNKENIETGIFNISLNKSDCEKNNTSNMNFNFLENIINRKFFVNSSSVLYYEENENKDLKEKSFGNFVLRNIIGYILNEIFKSLIENFKYEFERLTKIQLEEISDLFINTTVNGKNYSFYLKDNSKKILPNFSQNLFKEPFNFKFHDLNFEETEEKKCPIHVELTEIKKYLKEEYKNKNKNFLNCELKSKHTFKDLLIIIFRKVLNLESIKNDIQEKHKEDIKGNWSESILFNFFYFGILIDEKNCFILNKKDYYDYKVFFLIEILNVHNKFKIFLKPINSVVIK